MNLPQFYRQVPQKRAHPPPNFRQQKMPRMTGEPMPEERIPDKRARRTERRRKEREQETNARMAGPPVNKANYGGKSESDIQCESRCVFCGGNEGTFKDFKIILFFLFSQACGS
jgi:hypothetical protein